MILWEGDQSKGDRFYLFTHLFLVFNQGRETWGGWLHIFFALINVSFGGDMGKGLGLQCAMHHPTKTSSFPQITT